MNFASDNWAGASPKVLDAITRGAQGFAAAYGGDDIHKALGARFSELFEREVAFFLAPTGTAANSLGLSALCPPYGAIFAHEDAHIIGDEGGAPEFFTQGAKLVGIPGGAGKLTVEAVETPLTRAPGSGNRFPKPAVLALTQATEWGTVYTPSEVADLADAARRHNVQLFMDGARFANAVASLGCSPADITWKAGVDVLSFGCTKNGALMAEAVILFDKAKAEPLEWRRKRSGHVISKSRLIAAQFLAMVEDNHWLELAGHANAMATRLGKGLAAGGRPSAVAIEANEVFVTLTKDAIAKLRQNGARLYEWPASTLPPALQPKPEEDLVRLVTSFATTPEEVDAFTAAAVSG